GEGLPKRRRGGVPGGTQGATSRPPRNHRYVPCSHRRGDRRRARTLAGYWEAPTIRSLGATHCALQATNVIGSLPLSAGPCAEAHELARAPPLASRGKLVHR